MRPTPWLLAEPGRLQLRGFESGAGESYGAFALRCPRTGERLRVIVSDGDYKRAGLSPEYAWEHVSVSLPNRCPNWKEMDWIKDIFWKEDETVFQFHVPKADHINRHPYCLHLWRPIGITIPLPPKDTVG
jgi:hypothetical protein